MTVIKTVVANTVDEDIFAMGERKHRLTTAVLNEENHAAAGTGRPRATGRGGRRPGVTATGGNNNIEGENEEVREHYCCCCCYCYCCYNMCRL